MQRTFLALLPLSLVLAGAGMFLTSRHYQAQAADMEPVIHDNLQTTIIPSEPPKDYCPHISYGDEMYLCRPGRKAFKLRDPGGTWEREQ